MNIAILTLPLHNNYGGLLQAYALQFFLKSNGHDVFIVDRQNSNYLTKCLSIIKRIFLKYILQKKIIIRVWPNLKEESVISFHTKYFVNKYIQCTERISSDSELSLLDKYNFDIYIVGSDQVWRPRCSTWVGNYYLDFLKQNSRVKKIGYAISFGVNKWEYSYLLTLYYSYLAKKFNAISVREYSGLNLCDKYLNVKSTHVLDPTLLLDKSNYLNLIENNYCDKNKGKLMYYILDMSLSKKNIIKFVEEYLCVDSFTIMAKNKFSDINKKNISDCVFPSLSNWISGFNNADYIVTDSFHGVVFSIIFNKNFIAIGNDKRGMDRFISLLKMFDLEDRLIFSLKDLSVEKILFKIDYEKVNMKIKERKMDSIDFLLSNINVG